MAENLPSKQTREVNSFLMTELTPEFVKQAKLKRRELLAKIPSHYVNLTFKAQWH